MEQLYTTLKEALQTGNKPFLKKSLENLKDFYKNRTPSSDIKLNEENMKLLVNDVLPLVFYDVFDIRTVAIEALDVIIPHLNFANLQSNPIWPARKAEIIELFQTKIDKNQIETDSNWDKVWSIIVRLMHNNIIEGAATINKFLVIVEFGFRSADLNTRYQAFNCWQTLVEVFAQHGQLTSAKRLKLILVPLKSSKSKTERIAQQKFKIWWQLLAAFNKNLHLVDTTIVEPFIHFCFAPFCVSLKADTISPGKSYPAIRPKAIIALCRILGLDNEAIKKLAVKEKIDITKSIYSPEIFQKQAELLVLSCIECTKYSYEIHSESYDSVSVNYEMWTKCLDNFNILNMDIQKFEINMGYSSQTESKSIFQILVDSISKLYESISDKSDDMLARITADIVKAVAKSHAYLPKPHLINENVNIKLDDIKPFIQFVFCSKIEYPENVLQEICKEIFSFKNYADGKDFLKFLTIMISYVTDDDFSAMVSNKTAKIMTHIWISMSTNISIYLQQHKEPLSSEDLKMLIDFLLWPFENTPLVDYEAIFSNWKSLYTYMSKMTKDALLANLLCDSIKFTLTDKNNVGMHMIVKYYSTIFEATPTDMGPTTSPADALDLLNYILKNRGFRNYENDLIEVVDTINDFYHKISPSYFFKLASYTKNIIVEVAHFKGDVELTESITKFVNTLTERCLSATFHEEIKNQNLNIRKNCKLLFSFLQQNTENSKKKSSFKNIIDACGEKESKKDEFVPISSVWKFTPDKLTDHQKEKMKEKRTDIPALYNDMSQSQDSFVIKPWTPNKVVIPATQDNDTIIMNASDSEDINLNKKEDVVKKNKEDSKVDKENNNGATKLSKRNKEISRLLIDMVEGNTALTEQMEKKNTRRSSISNERELRPKRTKEQQSKLAKSDVKKKVLKPKESEKSGKKVKHEDKAKKNIQPVVEVIPKASPRKSLNFDDVDFKMDTTEGKESVNESQEVVECSQIIEKDRSLKVRRSMIKATPSKIVVSKNELKAMDTLPIESEVSVELNNISANTNNTNVTNTSQQLDNPSQTEGVKVSEMDTELNTVLDISKSDLPPLDDNSQTATSASEVISISSTETIKALGDINDFVAKSDTEMEIDSSDTFPQSTQIEQNAQNSQNTNSDDSIPLAQMDTALNTNQLSDAISIAQMDTVLNTQTQPQQNEVVTVNTEINTQTQQQPNDAIITIAQMNKILDSQKPDNVDEVVPEISTTPTKPQQQIDSKETEEVIGTPTLSPIKNLEDEMTPLSKSLNKNIMSSPEGNDLDERNADLLNNTLNISPISEDKSASSASSSAPLSEKKPVTLLKEKEKTMFSSPVNRTQKMLGSVFVGSPSTINKTPQINSPSSRNIALSGRGAQLINLSRNRKNESTPKPSVNSISLIMQPKYSPTSMTNDVNGKIIAIEHHFDSPKPDPPKHRDLLVFSKVLPSPQASPSVGILKRKLEPDHDDFESPINKRKRVSFHDPPVSASKEYIVQEEENRLYKDSNGTSKLSLKRKSKADSISELAKFNGTDSRNEDAESPEPEIDTTNEMSALCVTGESIQDVQDIEMSPPENDINDVKFKFKSEEDIFKFIAEKYSNAELIEKISSYTGKSLVDNTSAKIITKGLSNLMTQDNKMKHAVLDQLSEKHSSEFLDHAVQENSSTVVCARLALPTMIEYIFQQIKNQKPGESHTKQVIDGVKELCGLTSNTHLLEDIALFALQRQTGETFYNLMQKYFKST